MLSRRPGLSGALVFVCVALHASACAAVWPRARRAGTLTLHKRLMSLELKDKNLRRALAFLALVWSWLLYLLHTH